VVIQIQLGLPRRLPSNKKGFGRMQLKQYCIVHVGLVHHLKCASLDLALLAEDIDYLDIVHHAVKARTEEIISHFGPSKKNR